MALFKNVIAPLNFEVDVEGVKMQEWRRRRMIKGEVEFEVLLHQYTRASLKGEEPIARILLAIHR